jgi:hypothetical protein
MQISGDFMTLDGLMTGAAMESIDERERHLAIFTVDLNGYVCKNEPDADESKALFKGTYRECQAWIERRGIAAAFRFVIKHMHEVPELNARGMTPSEILALLFHIDE